MLTSLYYTLKPVIPRSLQLRARRHRVEYFRRIYANNWPIYEKAGRIPPKWCGWPDGKKFAFLLTHDVETSKGQQRCEQLMRIEKQAGFRSAFFFVPERYSVSTELLSKLAEEGFEAGVHGLIHDGKLYSSEKEFKRRALKINNYMKQWGCVGFSSPCMLHNLEYIGRLEMKYDISTYDTDPFEPQGGGVGTIFPFCVHCTSTGRVYTELQYTLSQDFTLFIMIRETNADVWKKKLDWIAQCGGMAHLKTHPDYMNFGADKNGIDEYHASIYRDFLEYVKLKYDDQYWHTLPKEMAEFCRKNVNVGPGSSETVDGELLCRRCKESVRQGRITFLHPEKKP